MERLSRRDLLSRGGKTALGAFALTVPEVLYRTPWTELAQAQTLPTVERTFIALIAAVNDAPEDDARTAEVARWVIAEFDKALPPLPDRSVSFAVAGVLDAYAVKGGHGPSFALAAPEGRLAVLRDMVVDPVADIRQVANQVLPFSSFAYWSDASLGRPSRPGDTMPQWQEIGWSGPSHGHLDDYLADWPTDPSFRPSEHHGN